MDSRSRLMGALLLSAQPFLLNLISIPATAFIIRSLGPTAYGQWAVAVSLIATTTFLTNLGLRAVFVRAVAREPERSADILADQLGVRGLLAVGAGLVALAAALALGYPPQVVYCVAISAVGLVLSSLATTIADLLNGRQQFSTSATIGMLAGLTLTACSVVIAFYSPAPALLAVGYLSGPLLSLLLLWLAARRSLVPVRFRVSVARARALFRECRALTLNDFFLVIQARAEQLLLPKFVGMTQFGFYSAGILPADRLAWIPDGVMTAFFPAIARGSTEANAQAAKEARRLVFGILLICLPLSVLVAFLAQPIAALLFPGRDSLCAYVIRITICALPLAGLSIAIHGALCAEGAYARAAGAGVRATITSLGVTIALVSQYGVAGAAWSYLLRWVISVAFLASQLTRTCPGLLTSMPLGRILISGALMAAALWWVTAASISPLLAVLGGGTVGMLIYSVALLCLGVVRASEIAELVRRKQVVALEQA